MRIIKSKFLSLANSISSAGSNERILKKNFLRTCQGEGLDQASSDFSKSKEMKRLLVLIGLKACFRNIQSRSQEL